MKEGATERCANMGNRQAIVALCGVEDCDRLGYSRHTQCGSLGLSSCLYLHKRAGNEDAVEWCIRQVWSEVDGVSAKTCQHAKKRKARSEGEVKVSEERSECAGERQALLMNESGKE